jgi:hypothetical protein
MNRTMRVYYYGILGAIGGLFGWLISNPLGLSFTWSVYFNDAIVGALIGLCIGLFIGAAEGLLTFNFLRALKAGAIGALLGLAAGAIGLPLGEFFFQSVGAGTFGRALGWGVFGTLIGVAEGITGGSQMWKGALGGLLGGLLGGVLLEVARQVLQDPSLGKAIGLILLGAAVGVLIALIVVLLSRAWIEVTSGKLRGTEFILDKFIKKGGPTVILGSDSLKADIAFPDPDVAPQHAILSGTGSHFMIKDMSTTGTYVDGKRVNTIQLADRQKIRIGNTELVYHEKR